jgi:hypothetical protein
MKQLLRPCAASTAVLVLTFLLFLATIQSAQAQTCSTPTIDMKLLVITNGKNEADFPAIKQILDYLGTPYDVLDMSVNTGGVTSAMLSDGSCHGYYQGVIFAFGGYIYTLPGMATLTAYEQQFAIRQLNWYMYPTTILASITRTTGPFRLPARIPPASPLEGRRFSGMRTPPHPLPSQMPTSIRARP